MLGLKTLSGDRRTLGDLLTRLHGEDDEGCRHDPGGVVPAHVSAGFDRHRRRSGVGDVVHLVAGHHLCRESEGRWLLTAALHVLSEVTYVLYVHREVVSL